MQENKDLSQVKTEIDNAIDMYENAAKVQVHQWLTTTDLLCALYLMKELEMKIESLLRQDS